MEVDVSQLYLEHRYIIGYIWPSPKSPTWMPIRIPLSFKYLEDIQGRLRWAGDTILERTRGGRKDTRE